MSGVPAQPAVTRSPVHLRATVGGESYALSALHVTEVAKFADVTPVPGAPPHILGVLNLRGQVTPVASLAHLLGLSGVSRDGPPRPARLVLVENEGVRLALAVDDVRDVAPFAGAVEPTDLPLLSGAALVEGTLVGIVDIAAVLRAAGEMP